jgi:glycerol-3-phosphate dehydrogenase subunit B
MAGMASTLFASNQGLSVCQVGGTREIGFASGLFDLLGVHPMIDGKRWDDPWAGIKELVRDIPEHPYAKLTEKDIKNSFDELLGFLEASGLPYLRHPDRNVRIITHMGTIKRTYCVPQTMWNGIDAFERRKPALLIDFAGLKGFSAGLIVAALSEEWPGLRNALVTFPGKEQMVEVLPEHMANALVISRNYERLADAIRPHVQEAEVVGIPAVLGLYQSSKVISDLAELIGVPVFEISTMPPSIPGLRLKEVFERGLREKRAGYFPHRKVLEVKEKRYGGFEITIGISGKEQTIISKGIVLATGRFIGGGLSADRKNIKEPIFDLPLYQPESRDQWHRKNFFDPRGHLLNQAGIETDHRFRPLGHNGQPVFDTLFAAGSILAHQDWKRMKCGTGLAISTSFGAVMAFIDS